MNRDITLALQATRITKRFPGVLANDHVIFSLEGGEFHALLAEIKTFCAFYCRTLLLRK
jgi:ABC-type sugar transport system ATPase subunit